MAVVTASNEAKVFQLASSMLITMDIASQMQDNATPIGYRKERDFDICKVELFACIVVFVSKAEVLFVDGLLLAILLSFLLRYITFKCIWAPVSGLYDLAFRIDL